MKRLILGDLWPPTKHIAHADCQHHCTTWNVRMQSLTCTYCWKVIN